MTITVRTVAIGTLCALVMAKWIALAFVMPWVPDYTVFWAAVRNIPLAYDDAALTQIQGLDTGMRPWVYPPSALLPLLPFGALPFFWSYLAFSATSLAAYLYAFRRESWWLLALAHPVFYTFWFGQMAFLVGALVLFALLDERAWVRGVLIGIAAAIKPQFLVLAPLLLDWPTFRWSLVGGAAMGVSSFVFGPALWLEWVEAVQRFPETVAILSEGNNMLSRAVTPLGMAEHWGISKYWAALPIGFAILAARPCFKLDWPYKLVALIGGSMFLSPYAMNYDLVLLAPAAVVFALRGNAWLAVASTALLALDGVYAPFAGVAFVLVVLTNGLRQSFLEKADEEQSIGSPEPETDG